MPSLEERIDDIIEDATRLAHTSDPNSVEQLRARLDELVADVRRTVPTDNECRYELILRSRQAKGLLLDATQRLRHNRDTAHTTTRQHNPPASA